MEVDIFKHDPFRKNSDLLITKDDIYGFSNKNHLYHPLYRQLDSMYQRCYNKNNIRYNKYGGRGIQIDCDEWLDENRYYNFIVWTLSNYDLNDIVNYRLQIDRIDNDKGYSPENCRFVTPSVNSKNRSTSSNRILEYDNIIFNNNQYEIDINIKSLNLRLRKRSYCLKSLLLLKNEWIEKYNLKSKGYISVSQKEIDKLDFITYEKWNNVYNNRYRNVSYSENMNKHVVQIKVDGKTHYKKFKNLSKAMSYYNKMLDENPQLTDLNKYMKIPKKYIVLEAFLSTIQDDRKMVINNNRFILSD